MYRIEQLALALMGLVTTALFFGSYPAALVPPGVDLDRPALRLGLIGAFLLGAIWWWCRCPPGARLRGSVLLAGMALGVLLLPSGFSGAASVFALPTPLLLSVLGIIVLATWGCRSALALLLPAAVFLLPVLYHLARDPSRYPEAAYFLAYLIVPAAVGVGLARGDPELRRTARVAVGIWLLMTVYGWLGWLTGQPVIGYTTNPNWFSAALAAVLPWAGSWLAEQLPGRSPRQRLGLAVALLLLMNGPLLWAAECRATVVAGGAVALLLIWHRIPRLAWRFALVLGLTAVAVAVILHFPEQFQRMNERNVRLPLWQSTIQLALAHPLVGVGPGNFEREHRPYHSRSTYHQRLVASVRVEHPHNELLWIAACLGWPAAIAWLALLWPLVGDLRGAPRLRQLAWFSACTIIGHAMFDRPMTEQPSALIGLCAIGICWQPYLRPSGQPWAYLRRGAAQLAVGVAAAAFIGLAAWPVVRIVRRNWHEKLARQYDLHQESVKVLEQYELMATLDPRDPVALYGAATAAVYKTHDVRKGLDYLNRLTQVDPDFAHLHRLYGRILGELAASTEQPPELLRTAALAHFQRDCELYPGDLPARFWLYFAQVDQGDWAEAGQTWAGWRWLNADKVRLELTVAGAQQRTQQWLLALQHGDEAGAGETAVGLLHQLYVPADLEPLAFELPAPVAANLSRDCDSRPFRTDGAYWRDCLARAQLLATAAAPEGTISPPAVAALVTADHVAQYFSGPRTRLAATPQVDFAFLAWLNEGCGWETLVFGADTASPMRALVIAGGEFYLVATPGGPVRLLGRTTEPTALAAAAAAERLPESAAGARLFLTPSALVLNDLKLAGLVATYGPERRFLPAPEPASLRVARTRQAVAALGCAVPPGPALVWTSVFPALTPPVTTGPTVAKNPPNG